MTHSALSPNPAARKRPAVAVDVDAAARRGLRRIWPGRISLGALALIGSSLTGLVIGAIVACILVLHARNAVREETDSAFHLASAIATVRLPTAFMREDMLYRATELANEIDGLRHVSARLVDARGQVLAGSDGQRRGANRAPEFLYHLLTPTPRSFIFPIRQYPNVVGLLYLETDPPMKSPRPRRNLPGHPAAAGAGRRGDDRGVGVGRAGRPAPPAHLWPRARTHAWPGPDAARARQQPDGTVRAWRRRQRAGRPSGSRTRREPPVAGPHRHPDRKRTRPHRQRPA
ncbi:LapD/MoxY N-terminal periplasmic domain-containing protein [Paracoccus sp. DMF-8]|uniref:LapD/MoxY N-terminal periplasmic domain-containing protein n=1 Tax=Paracoccus sp. DMF-8 TaxID=3019445 RepID=UPI0023E7C753|nr:LapD/MoxY N-terminal periplasmic domain-containing protein [Paracoccus sp. DMF-8]MDF3606501.1 LapD/MoxY N-terminal periplasmic domain-containing protein [Paracoccus sp. DMF-8]